MKRQRLAPILLLLLWLASALRGEEALTYLRLADPLTLDPGKFEDFYSQEAIANVFEGLVRLDAETLEVEPCLAERWEVRDNARRWLFRLRRGVRFHDGREFNAGAVVSSLSRRMANGNGEYTAFARVFPFIAEVRAVDDWSVEIRLLRPYASFLASLVDLRAAIVAPGAGAGFQPIGTGPYAVSDWGAGRPLVLRRHAGYWGGAARIDTLIFKSEKSASLRVSQIKNGSVQVAMVRSAAEYGELAGRADVRIISQASLSTGYLGFNCFRAPFNLPLVRQAFAHLLNKGVLVRRVFQNLAEPADSFLPPPLRPLPPQPGRFDFSLPTAQKLLREAGLAAGFSCTLYYSEGQYGIEEIVRAIAAKAHPLHVQVRTVKLPFDRFFKAVQEGEPDLFIMAWGYTADRTVFLNPMFQLVPGSGRMMAMSPGYAAALSAADSAVEERARDRHYTEAQRLLERELPLVPLFRLNELAACRRQVKRLRMDPLGFLLFKDAALDGR